MKRADEKKEVLKNLQRLRTESPAGLRKDMNAVADSLEALLERVSAGGKARAKKLSKKRRVEIARKAAKARWSK